MILPVIDFAVDGETGHVLNFVGVEVVQLHGGNVLREIDIRDSWGDETSTDFGDSRSGFAITMNVNDGVSGDIAVISNCLS